MNSSGQGPLSVYVKKEFDTMHERLKPLVKRSLVYSMLAIPLFTFSLFNLYYLIFGQMMNDNVTSLLIIFSSLGALGLALFTESMHKNKEIQQSTIKYIKDRVAKSNELTNDVKELYLKKINTEPLNVYTHFSEFLEQEERMKRTMNFSHKPQSE